MMNNILYGFSVSFQPINLLTCLLGAILGTLVGVLPGLGPIAAISILLPITFKMSTVSSLIMLGGIYYGAQYGGSSTSILVNIPGETSSVVTCLDGYQMALQGRAGAALGISAFGSFIAGTFGVLGVMLLAPLVVQLAVKFGPPDFVALYILGLFLVGYMATRSKVKAWTMVVLGLLLSTVGLDIINGSPRFDFGSLTLLSGIGIAPMCMGLFGIGEVLVNLEQDLEQRQIVKTSLKGLFPNKKDWRASIGPIGRGTVLGFFLGIIPGVSLAIPTFISYGVEKRLSKTPERFGKGAIEGVAGPESTNNAAAGGTLIPLLSLGIPPNPSLALLMGAMMIHGVAPGPLLMQEHPDIFWGVVCSMYAGNLMLLVLNLPLIPLWVKILKIPYYLFFPLIILFCMIGVYSLNSNYMDVIVMVSFGLVGYLMRKFEYEPAPLILAFILGQKLEISVRQSLVYSLGDFSIFVRRPIAVGLFAVVLILILSSVVSGFRRRKAVKRTQLC